jgi:hypothetical protein
LESNLPLLSQSRRKHDKEAESLLTNQEKEKEEDCLDMRSANLEYHLDKYLLISFFREKIKVVTGN